MLFHFAACHYKADYAESLWCLLPSDELFFEKVDTSFGSSVATIVTFSTL